MRLITLDVVIWFQDGVMTNSYELVASSVEAAKKALIARAELQKLHISFSGWSIV